MRVATLFAAEGNSAIKTVFQTKTVYKPYFCISLHGSFKDVRAEIFYNTDFFFILLLQSDNELPMSEMQKNWGITNFVFEIKRVENYPNFDKSALITRHGLNRCQLKNNKNDSLKTHFLS